MNAYLAQILINIKLTFRDRTVIFFNYAFPLVFFFAFAALFKAERGGAIIQVLTMVLTIGVLGTGFFGAGIRSVQDRELNILRRFKVAPISPAPMLVSSLVTGLINFLPSALLMILLSHLLYGMEIPRRWISLLVFLSLGVLAFRAIGLIIASVVNSMQESQILVQLLYFPMLMLSGATFPLTLLPNWLQIFAQFLPSTYLITGMQGILGHDESFVQNLSSAGALLLTTLVAFFVCMKLFRWEKDERLPGRSKLWILAVLAPFFVLGIWQAQSKENVEKAKLLNREQRRARSFLIQNARIFVGNGKVIESGAVLVRNGKIEQVWEGAAPEAQSLKADAIEGAGKTVVPGLIDVHVHLAATGGFSEEPPAQVNLDKQIPRELAAYLYTGITAVKSVGDPLDQVKKARAMIASGERLGAELFLCGPMFTTTGGHGTEYFKQLPDSIRKMVEAQTVRTPKSAAEGRQQVDDLKKAGVDGIKAILETGTAGMLFNRMDVDILRGVAAEARAQNLPIVIHTGDAHDVADALSVGTNGIEHGSLRDKIGDDLFKKMKAQGVTYDPTLTVIEGFSETGMTNPDLLDRPLLQQSAPPALLTSTRKFLQSANGKKMGAALKGLFSMDRAKENLLHAWQNGVTLVTGSDAGNPLVIHGPTIHRELELWVDAGIPAPVALQAATYNAAKLLRVDNRMGLIAKGHDATLLLISGNPLKDIKSIENVQTVFLKGERIDRTELFDQ